MLRLIKVQEYEFTRRAAQRFRQVVSLDSFEDEDADVFSTIYIKRWNWCPLATI